MSVPSAKRDALTVTKLPAGEIQALADISFHQVWWRIHWVLWFGEPFDFEKRRPWSHRPLTHLVMSVLTSVTAVLWTLAAVFGAAGWVIAAAATSTTLLGLVAAVVVAEVRFWAWWSQNADRSALDPFRRPERLHAEVAESEAALRALRKAGDPEQLVTMFALEHGRLLRGWRSYGTAGWVRLLDIADTKPLRALHEALTGWREINEAWTDEAAWESEFNGPAQLRRRGLLARVFNTADEDPVSEAALKVTSAARLMRRSLETAAHRGLSGVRKAAPGTDLDRAATIINISSLWTAIGGLAVIGAILLATFFTSIDWPEPEVAPQATSAPSSPETSDPTPEPSTTSTPDDTEAPADETTPDPAETDEIDEMFSLLISYMWPPLLLAGLLTMGMIVFRMLSSW